ncbi:MAG: diguanylate cyclase [Actinomycetota bacterium]
MGSTLPAEGTTGSERRARARLQAAFDNVVDAIVLTDADLQVVAANDAATELTGGDPSGISGLDFVHPEDLSVAEEAFATLLAHPGERIMIDLRMRALGVWRPVEVAATNLLDTPDVEAIIFSFRDRRPSEALSKSESLFRTLATSAPVGIVTGDRPWEVSFANRRFAELIGSTVAELQVDGWGDLIEPEDRRNLELMLVALEPEDAGDAVDVVLTCGRTVQLTVTRLRHGGYVAAATDMTETHAQLAEARAAEAVWAYAATHDQLTGLANRSLGIDRIEHGLHRLRRRDQLVVVAFVDLDRFKDVNDAYGHDAGDAVLRSIGGRLRDLTRADDTVVRWGGDEFVVVAAADDMHGVDLLGRRLIAALSRPVALDVPISSELELGVSIGIAATGDATTAVDELVGRADRAMYVAKRRGGGLEIDASTPPRRRSAS